VLIMPSRRFARGQTAVRLGRDDVDVERVRHCERSEAIQHFT